MTASPAPADNTAHYPFQHWWVVAQSSELVAGQLLARRVLGLDVVLWRSREGKLVALADRCPHRGLPLSMGKLTDDGIACGYHGFRYAANGRCVQVPSQQDIPPRAEVHSFPVVERAPFIWIWTGDPARAKPEDAPFYPWLNDPQWVHALGHLRIECNYMALKENVLDLTHFAFAHASSFEMDDDYGAPPACTVEEGKVVFRQAFPGKPLPPFYGDHCGLGRKPVDRYDEGISFSPAEHVFTARIVDPSPAPGGRSEFQVKFHHMTTPESPTSHHYWWIMARDHGLGAAAEQWMREVITLGFEEDRVILEAIQRRINDATGPLPEISVLADTAGLQARRQAARLVAAEQNSTAST